MAAVAIGAVIPAATKNHPEYFACHPELFVQLLGAGLALGPELDPEFRRTRQLLVAWLGTPYRLKYAGILGNWKVFDRF